MALTLLDRDLLNRCIAAEPLAWQQFVDRYLGLIHHVVRHTSHARSADLTFTEVEDLAADVLGHLVAHDARVFRHFRGESSLATYVAVIVRRWTVNQLARRAAIRRRAEDEAAPVEAADSTPTFELREEVEHLVDRLPNRQAALVRGHYLQGKTYRTLATELHIPVNSVGPNLTRALAKMRSAGDR